MLAKSRLAVAILLSSVLMGIGCRTPTPPPEPTPPVATEPTPKRCPACARVIEEGNPGYRYVHRGKTYSFYTLECVERFKKDPDYYLQLAHNRQ